MTSPPIVPPLHTDQARWFAEEVQPHEGDLRAWLRSRFPKAKDVDDVVQESYVRLLRARQTSTVSCARAYLFATARNVALALFRRPQLMSGRTTTDAAVLNVAEEGRDVVEQVSTRQEVALLLDAIDALPGRCREIFILRKLQGVSQRDIAARLNLSEKTVEVQVARGARRIVKCLRERGLGSSHTSSADQDHG